MRTKIKSDSGVAGLTILLSLVTMLFVIGLIVMIFSLMGSELQDATYTPTTKTVSGEVVTVAYFTNGTGYTLTSTDTHATGYTIVALYNASTVLQTSGNYSLTGKVLKNATAFEGGANMKVNYTYTYDASNDATRVMSNTTSAVGSVVDWYPIFIVIGAMVVLILLTVIIITAIRGSGMMGGEGSA